MNIGLPRTRPGHRATYLPALFAALSALAMIAALGVWQATGSSKATPAPAARQLTLDVAHSYPMLVLYVVESDEQYDSAVAAESEAANEREASGIADAGYQLMILRIKSWQDKPEISEVVNAWTDDGSYVWMSDMRGR